VRVTPDDEVYRVNTVWLGPSGLTFPWTARYQAYATWLITLLVVLFVEAVTPLTVHVPPIWELCITTLFTYGVMGFVDHERPIRAVYQTFMVDLTTPRPGTRIEKARVQPSVRVRESRLTSGSRRARRRAPREGGTGHPTDKRPANVGAG
jgi:hypothetical protein